MHTRVSRINLSPRLGTVRGFWRKLHRTRTHAITTLSSSPLLSPLRSWRLLCIAQPGQRAICWRERERERRKGRKSTRSKKRDTVMTQTSCILVPHKAASYGRERALLRTLACLRAVSTITLVTDSLSPIPPFPSLSLRFFSILRREGKRGEKRL